MRSPGRIPHLGTAPSAERRLSAPHTAKGTLQRHALAALRQHEANRELPTSIHFVFYELEQAGLQSKEVPERTDGKKGRRFDQDLTDAITHLRQEGFIPWDWIVDDTRTLHRLDAEDTLIEEIDSRLDYIDINPWAGEHLPFLLTESRTIGGVFARGIASEYRVPVAATNGQAGGFLVTVIAPFLRERACRIQYVGDLDDAGGDIEKNTRRVLERHLGQSLEWERVAITKRQADGLRRRGLTPIVKRDGRRKDGRTHEAWEAEALGQGPITEIIRRRLNRLLPEPLADVLEREEQERAAIRADLGLR